MRGKVPPAALAHRTRTRPSWSAPAPAVGAEDGGASSEALPWRLRRGSGAASRARRPCLLLPAPLGRPRPNRTRTRTRLYSRSEARAHSRPVSPVSPGRGTPCGRRDRAAGPGRCRRGPPSGLEHIAVMRRPAPCGRSARPAGPSCPAALISRMISKISWTMNGARPSEGSSSSSSRGRAISARPIASICCSPPESVPAVWLMPLLQPREQSSSTSLHVAATPRRSRRG